MYYEKFIKPFIGTYEGDEDSTAVVEADVTETSTSEETTEVTSSEKVFTQGQINKMMAEEKKKFQERDQRNLKELETLRTTFKGTKEEKERLDKQIEQLRMDSMSAADKAKAEKEGIRKQAETEKKVLEEDRDLWQRRYTQETIARALTDAAGDEKAISSDPILAMLQSKTRLVPSIDKDTGKENGELSVKTRMDVINDKNEEVELDLSPKDAVRKLKENPRYGFLFQGEKTAGLGSSQVSSGSDLTESLKGMDAKSYREKGRTHALKK